MLHKYQQWAFSYCLAVLFYTLYNNTHKMMNMMMLYMHWLHRAIGISFDVRCSSKQNSTTALSDKHFDKPLKENQMADYVTFKEKPYSESQ